MQGSVLDCVSASSPCIHSQQCQANEARLLQKGRHNCAGEYLALCLGPMPKSPGYQQQHTCFSMWWTGSCLDGCCQEGRHGQDTKSNRDQPVIISDHFRSTVTNRFKQCRVDINWYSNPFTPSRLQLVQSPSIDIVQHSPLPVSHIFSNDSFQLLCTTDKHTKSLQLAHLT